MLQHDPGREFRTDPPVRSASVLIEGWRGLNHSYSLVNQYQILELLEQPELTLYHEDVPTHWSRSQNNGEFLPTSQQALIDNLASAGEQGIDCVYRISSPIRGGEDDDHRKTITFMVTEYGLSQSAFADGSRRRSFFTQERNIIVTPTRWSRDRLVEFGFPAQKIHVVPHGVDRSIFYPLTASERIGNRASLGIAEAETVFLNIGAPFWNKGFDLLLVSFARLRNAGRRVRLILKDQRELYGPLLEDAIRRAGDAYPPLLQEDVINAILLVTSNLTRQQLRLYYGIADCYVSPYRAEGFNLPVLEAIACGTPTIVTGGGATDDFCPDAVSLRISAVARSASQTEDGSDARYLEPDLDSLTDAMATFPGSSRRAEDSAGSVREQLLDAFSWRRAGQRLTELILRDD